MVSKIDQWGGVLKDPQFFLRVLFPQNLNNHKASFFWNDLNTVLIEKRMCLPAAGS